MITKTIEIDDELPSGCMELIEHTTGMHFRIEMEGELCCIRYGKGLLNRAKAYKYRALLAAGNYGKLNYGPKDSMS